MNDLEMTINRRIAASREKVFKAWLSPGTLAKFMRPDESMQTARVETDPVKGGRFSIIMVTPERETLHTGTYLEIDPYSRLSFTWESEYSPDDSVVTIELSEPQPGTTDVTLKQVRFYNEEQQQAHGRGWAAILDCLDHVLG
jgi:uncharacterized protein YndB with AHSA1/START domain